jgi:hypothetical protein
LFHDSFTKPLRLEVTTSSHTMSDKKESDIDTTKPYGEPEVMATAVPAGGNEPPIPAGHARFYCNKCHTVRPTAACFRTAALRACCRDNGLAKRDEKMRIIVVRLCSAHSRLSLSQNVFLCRSRTTFPTGLLPGAAQTAWNSTPLHPVNVPGAQSCKI